MALQYSKDYTYPKAVSRIQNRSTRKFQNAFKLSYRSRSKQNTYITDVTKAI